MVFLFEFITWLLQNNLKHFVKYVFSVYATWQRGMIMMIKDDTVAIYNLIYILWRNAYAILLQPFFLEEGNFQEINDPIYIPFYIFCR